ncbi:MAG: tRNA 2-thiouridine(34) synthase MnmA [Planctomycetota bacterium]
MAAAKGGPQRRGSRDGLRGWTWIVSRNRLPAPDAATADRRRPAGQGPQQAPELGSEYRDEVACVAAKDPHPVSHVRVLVAMSGGVDSSVVALMLKQQGHDVVGVFMRNGVAGKSAEEKSCCSASDARDASVVADRLDIPFYAVDYQQEFARLMDHFAAEYRAGRTPNPCVLCNQDLKFGHLLSLADDVGAEKVATGHYAQVQDGELHTAVDDNKDQTYYLFGVEREALARTMFPLGGMTKAEVRAVATEAGLVTAEKPESMEICFVTSGSYRDVVRARGGTGRPGRFVDAAGSLLGVHDGVDGFTVGQRKGLPALGIPHYVAAIDPASGDVTLVPRDGLQRRVMFVSGCNWLCDEPTAGQPLRAEVKVRARHRAVPATIEPLVAESTLAESTLSESNLSKSTPSESTPSESTLASPTISASASGRRTMTAKVTFDVPVDAITPGQAAVFYRGTKVLGGAWIDGSA